MKEAVMLIVMLLMGRFASQSSHAFGMNLWSPETTLEQALYQRIDVIYDENPGRLATIGGKLPTIMTRFQDNKSDLALLTNIKTYIDYKLTDTDKLAYSDDIISALGSLFN